MEVKDVLENYTNLEKECESAKQTVSIELQVSLAFPSKWNIHVFLLISLAAVLADEIFCVFKVITIKFFVFKNSLFI